MDRRVVGIDRRREARIDHAALAQPGLGDTQQAAVDGDRRVGQRDQAIDQRGLHQGRPDIGRSARLIGRAGQVEQDAIALLLHRHMDADRLVDVFLDLGVTHKRIDRSAVRHDIERMLSTYWGLPLGELKVAALLNDVYSVMRRHHLHLPSNLALLLKTVIMVEGLGVNIDPDFRFTKSLTPYTEGLVLRQYSPLRWIRSFRRTSLDLAKFGAQMPQHLRRIVTAAEDGNLQIGMRPEGFDPLVDRLERIVNRIVLGVLAAAFINGLAVLVSVYRPPGWAHWGWAVFLFGFLCALLLGVYLAWNILRPRHT